MKGPKIENWHTGFELYGNVDSVSIKDFGGNLLSSYKFNENGKVISYTETTNSYYNTYHYDENIRHLPTTGHGNTGKGGDALFQFLVDLLSAADEPHRGKAEAPLIVASLCGIDQFLAAGQTQIVVGAHVHHAISGSGVDAGALGGGDDPLFPPGTGLANGLQLIFDQIQRSFHKDSPFYFPLSQLR